MKLEKIVEVFNETIISARFSRKGFLRLFGFVAGLFLISSKNPNRAFAKATETLQPRKKKDIKTDCDIAVCRGKSPSAMTRKSIDALGGMGRFVKKGDTVVVKPNIGWDRSPEQAANTNPEVVETIVKMCFESGAKIVKVFDFTCNDGERCYNNSGIAAAAKKAGATVFQVSDWKFYPGLYPQNSHMEEWPMFRDAVACDCFINVPIAKHHGLTKLTLSIKNLMGVCGGSRGTMHWNVGKKLAETLEFIKPELTVIDAYRILLRNGPSGGRLEDVKMANTVIASADPVLADSYATTLFGMKPEDIGYIKESFAMGLGSMNIKNAKLKELIA